MERIYEIIVDRPRPILLAIVLATVGLGWLATGIRTDTSVDALLASDDPARIYYDQVREQFGSDEVGIVAIRADDVYAPAVLEKIQRLTTKIEAIDGVAGALSLTNAKNPIEDVLDPPLVVDAIPTTPEGRAELVERVKALPIYEKNLVSPDGRTAGINVFFDPISDDEFVDRGIDLAIQALVDAEDDEVAHVVQTGLPRMKAYATRAMQEDLRRLVPLTFGVIVAILFVVFRSARGVLLPALTVLVTLAWTLGIMAATGGRLTLSSTALPPLLLVLGSVYALHVVSEAFEECRADRPLRDALLDTLRKSTPPVFIAAFTTAIGFLSLLVSPVPSIREMGIYASVGIGIAFLQSIVLVPSAFAILPLPRAAAERDFLPTLGAGLARLARFTARHRVAVVASVAVLSVVFAVMSTRIRVDSNFQSFFRPEDPVQQATDLVNRHLAGAMALHVVIDGQAPDLMRKLDTLERIRDLQNGIDAIPGVEKTISFVDYAELLDEANQAGGELYLTPEGELVERPGSGTTFWEKPEQLGAVFSLVASSPGTFERVVDPEFRRSDILVRTSLAKASEISDLVRRIDEIARRTFPPEIRVVATGTAVLHTRTSDTIVTGQIQSLALAAVVIFLIMTGMFLSARVGFLAMLPNVFPILFFFALMGMTGAVLSLATSVIASIVLGIAVDDTVHVMTRLSREVRETGDQELALDRTLTTVGKPVVFSTVFLSLGFLVLCLSSFVPVQEFGYLSATTIVVALLADLVFLPALVATTRVITLWDVLYLALGKDPHKTIPIFATLGQWQAKIVALMGELQTFPEGAAIIRQGEVGNEMYVIIEGSANVIFHSGGSSRVVKHLGRGDVFGEMGLIRHHERSADVVALGEVSVMALDEGFLSRVQRRYPRIATKIFLNIARILSDRLEVQTRR